MSRTTGFSAAVREIVLMRSGGNCEVMVDKLCELNASTIHHRRPRGMGGSSRSDTNDADNGLAVCRVCHNIVEHRREWSRANGFLVSQAETPGDVPVWWRCATNEHKRKKMVLLDKGGGKTEVGE